MITGYHTVEDRGNPDDIEVDGPFHCGREDAWLGHGFYFWDTNISWAHEWGEGNMARSKRPWRDGYVICQALVENDPDVMFDLHGNIAHQMEFEEILELMEADACYHGKNPLVAEILQFMQDRGFFVHKSVRAADAPPKKMIEVDFRPPKPGKNTRQRPYMTIGQRIQICLFEKSPVTLRDFSIVFPDKYLK